MAVKRRHTLKQGNCKNAFCQGILPPDEITIVKPPIGDPNTKKDEYWLLKRTLYSLQRSPKHWYNKIRTILNTIGLQQNAYNPCLFSGNIVNPSDPSDSPLSSRLTLGLYVDDFVYFSEDPAAEAKFEHLLNERAMVDFMGTVKWFLGTCFQWMAMPKLVQVHISQTGFTSHLVEENNIHLCNVTPNATPYRFGLPIDACPESDKDKKSPTFLKRNKSIRALSDQLVGLRRVRNPALLRHIPSCQATSTNLPAAISTPLYMSYTTSI
jgi:hypothetical protein